MANIDISVFAAAWSHGMSSKVPSGVQIRKDKIRIYFTFNGQRRWEPLALSVTPDHIAYAGNKVAMIRSEIKLGTFDYSSHFPESKHLIKNQLNHWVDLWLDEKKQTVSHETFRSYKGKADNHIRPTLGSLQPHLVSYDVLLKWKSGALSHLSTKTIRDIINILSGILTMCQRQHVIVENPAVWLEIGESEAPECDPFSLNEIELIAATPTLNLSARNMAVFMIWSGVRPSEAFGLAWDDVDFEAEAAYIRRSMVTGIYKKTKTRRSTRLIELFPDAVEALKDQYAITGDLEPIAVDVVQRDNRTVRSEKIKPVFISMYTGKPLLSTNAYVKGFWKKHLALAKVRYRSLDQCRHTFSSQMLSIPEVPDSWIIQQLGHADPTMLYRHYGKLMQQRNRQRVVDIAALNIKKKLSSK